MSLLASCIAISIIHTVSMTRILTVTIIIMNVITNAIDFKTCAIATHQINLYNYFNCDYRSVT